MRVQYPIHDLYFHELDPQEVGDLTRTSILYYDDHLLRRFGYAEFVRAKFGAKYLFQAREVADEVWALIEGAVRFVWKDTRRVSPSFNEEYETSSDKAMLFLVPFGVEFGFEVVGNQDAVLIRLATHSPENLSDEQSPGQGQTK